MEHVRWLDDRKAGGALIDPVVIAAFTGWNDAGDAASIAMQALIESCGARALAEVDPECFNDFTSTRPQVQVNDAKQRRIVWPTVGVWTASLAGADVLLMLGPEPALRWRLFCEQLADIALLVGAKMAITLGGLVADVPHSRPTRIVGASDDAAMIERYDLKPSPYQGSIGINAILLQTLSEAGLATAALWAAVPSYASELASPNAAMALVDRACAMIGTPVPPTGLSELVDGYEAEIAELLTDDDLRKYVSCLESVADETEDDNSLIHRLRGLESTDDPAALSLEIEQFLRDQG